MSNKELIKNILEDIGYKLNSLDTGLNQSKSKESLLVFLTGSDADVDDVFANLKNLEQQGCSLIVCLSKNGERIIGLDRIKRLLNPKEIYQEEHITEIDRILKQGDTGIAPVMTQNTLSKIALGIQDTLIPALVWRMLWENKRIIINSNASLTQRVSSCKNTKMQKTIEGHLERVKDYGAEVINNNDYLKYIGVKEAGITGITNESIEERKVITEGDIRKVNSGTDKIIVSKGTIITPLAKDRAKDKGIEIIYK